MTSNNQPGFHTVSPRQAQTEKQFMQARTEATFQVRRIRADQPSAAAILNDLCSAKSASNYYRDEISKRHKRFEMEKQWPYLSPEEAKLIQHYQNYMVNVKQQQDKIMKTKSYKLTQREVEASDTDSTASAVSSSASVDSPHVTYPVVLGNPTGPKDRSRRINECKTIGQTVYTVYSQPEVFSYKEMAEGHATKDTAQLERVRKLVFEIKKSPKYGADIMRGFVARNAQVQRHQMLDPADSRCLMNLSNLFYDNLYLEEIKGSPQKQSYFVLAFQNFVNQLQFKKDCADNVIVASPAALKVTKVLFEGQTRKIGANNFLRHIFTSKFSKIFIPQLQELIIRQILNSMNGRKRGNSGKSSRGSGSKTPNAERSDRSLSNNAKKQSSDQDLAVQAAQPGDGQKKRSLLRRVTDSITGIFSSEKRRERSNESFDSAGDVFSSSQEIANDDFFEFAGMNKREGGSQNFAGNGPMPDNLRLTNIKSARSQASSHQQEPEINSIEYERIRIMLGAGQHGDQPRLSDIFHSDDKIHMIASSGASSQASSSSMSGTSTPSNNVGGTSLGNKDPYNAMRILNQEIDDEIQNKNSMLKDLMVDQHGDSSQKELQVQFDTEQFFNLQRQILNGGSPPDSSAHDPLNKTDKDLTDVCKGIVHQVLKSLVISTDLMPYTLRAMMKILVMKSENVAHPSDVRQSIQDQPKNKPKLGRNQIYMLADLMIGGWLNTGFRNPNCFGVLQPTDREKGFSHNLFQSCRVIFEHLFSLQKLPFKSHQNFCVKRINDYINEYKDFVYIFYTRIIDVELPEPRDLKSSSTLTAVAQAQQNQQQRQSDPQGKRGSTLFGSQSSQQTQQVLKYSVNSSLIRLQDLQLIGQILRSQQAVLRFGDISNLAQSIDWSRFKDAEETYFLFTKLKKDRIVKMPSQEQNELKALRIIDSMVSHFPAVKRPSKADLADQASSEPTMTDNGYSQGQTVESLAADGSVKQRLRRNFSWTIWRDKKGQNPASLLVKVLYKHLCVLLESGAILVDESLHSAMSFDALLEHINKGSKYREDASGIVIACQLMKKALKGLRLLPKKKMSQDEKVTIALIQNRLLEKFVQAFRDTTKHSYFHALVTQDLKLQKFESDLERFVYRSRGLQESIEKVIAQWQIAKISAQEVSMCVYQNQMDEFPCFQGIFLTRNCPIDQEWAALYNVIAFDIFDTPRLPTNLNNQQQYLVPNQNRLLPARKDKQKIINAKYKQYTDFTWVSILRPMCNHHREITFLESLLLYLTQECKQIFTQLIRCDYLLESFQVKSVRSQNKALLKNYKLSTEGHGNENDKKGSNCRSALNKSPFDLSRLKGTKLETWAAEWIPRNQLAWKLWNAMNKLHSDRSDSYDDMSSHSNYSTQSTPASSSSGPASASNEFVRNIEIFKKFAKMQFIQHSIREVPQGKHQNPTYLLEIDQLLQEKDAKIIKKRMSDSGGSWEIRDHGNFLKTFDFFLDNLLCDFSQNVDQVKSYDQFLQQDMNSEKIRQSCQEFILRRMHAVLFEKMQTSDWDRAMFKVITNRKNKMQNGHKPGNPTKPLFEDKEKDLNLYKVSIDMLKQLPKEETPRAKRQLLNEAFNLAKHALSVLKEVEQHDHDYLFAYLMYYACTSGGRRRYDFRLFQQLVFMREFGGTSSSHRADETEDAIDIQFNNLRTNIQTNATEQAIGSLIKSSFVIF